MLFDEVLGEEYAKFLPNPKTFVAEKVDPPALILTVDADGN